MGTYQNKPIVTSDHSLAPPGLVFKYMVIAGLGSRVDPSRAPPLVGPSTPYTLMRYGTSDFATVTLISTGQCRPILPKFDLSFRTNNIALSDSVRLT